MAQYPPDERTRSATRAMLAEIDKRRKAKGWSLNRLAEEAEINRTTLYEPYPSLKVLMRLAEVLDGDLGLYIEWRD